MFVTILTKYHIWKGIKVFGNPGVNAFLKELKQLHGGMVMNTKNPDDISHEENRVALQYLIVKNKDKKR